VTKTRADRLRDRLNFVAEKTEEADNLGPLASFVDFKAEEAWVEDEFKSGRAQFRFARRQALGGLAALDNYGNLDFAENMAWSALKSYAAALECQLQRIRPSDRGGLERAAKRRGRPPGSKNVKGRI
jgi:hypothetical protein